MAILNAYAYWYIVQDCSIPNALVMTFQSLSAIIIAEVIKAEK